MYVRMYVRTDVCMSVCRHVRSYVRTYDMCSPPYVVAITQASQILSSLFLASTLKHRIQAELGAEKTSGYWENDIHMCNTYGTYIIV